MKKVKRFLILVFLAMPFLLQAQLKPSDAVSQMTRGINIGNTMEAPSEGAWNAPIKEYYFDDLKAAGFNTIRIPINWWNHTSKTAPYTIDAAWLNRVEQVIDWGLARGLFIEMNTHHETQLFGDFNKYLPMYISIWGQIATRFKGKSDHLLFELLNEPHGAPTVANMNDFNTRVVKEIRKTNPTRLVVYSGNMWANSFNLINPGLVNPAPGDKYLMGYYHSYDPSGFGLSGTGTFGSDADKQGIWNRMQSVTDWTKKSGILAYLGEFGAVSKGDLNSRFRYYACVVDYAMQHNLPFQVWDSGGGFEVYNRGGRSFNEIKDILIHYFPQSPTNFTATNNNGVVLKWTNRAPSATSILVQRKLTNSGSYITVATISATATTYTDVTAPAGTYYYRVITNASPTLQYYGYPQQVTATGGNKVFIVSLNTDKSTICSSKSATLTATPVNAPGTISKVEFYEGNTLIGTDVSSLYTNIVSNPTIGTHTYTAKATSSTGATATSNPIDVVMGNGAVVTPYVLINDGLWTNQTTATACVGASIKLGPQPATATGWSWKGPNGFVATTREVSLMPLVPSQAGVYTATYDDGSGCPGTASITVTANSTPAPVVVTPVTYNQNDVATPLTANGINLKWYSDATAGLIIPTAPIPSTVTVGTSSYFVSQTQNSCESSRSKIDVVVVNNKFAPQVSIIQPLTGTSVGEPATITIIANATDSDGTIAKVDFYNGTTLIGTRTEAPYSIVWDNVPAGLKSINAKATDNDGLTTTSSIVTVNVTPIPVLPSVSISSPLNGAIINAPANISIMANVNPGNMDIVITKVEFYVGDLLIGTDLTAPYTINWPVYELGAYPITVKVYDNLGNVSTSTPITITIIKPANVPPTIALTAPVKGSTLLTPTDIAIAATASDNDGSVTKVDFYSNNVLISTDTIAPFTAVITNATVGTYSISATATDNEGATTKSLASSVTVKNPPIAPQVVITSLVNGAIFTAPATITITANATDADGTIAKVDFYSGTTLLGSDATAPYSFVWTNMTAAPSYTITAKATDNSGLSTTSAPVSIVVNPQSNCSFPALTAANWVVRNNWNDHTTNGITVASDNTGIKVSNRAYGQNFVWVISTTKYALKAGVSYTFSYDIQGNYSIIKTEVGLASGYLWDGPTLSTATVVAPAGYNTNKVNSKSIIVKPTVSGNYNIAIKVSLAAQPPLVNSYYIRNLKFCTSTTLKNDEVDLLEPINPIDETVEPVKLTVVYPNPTSSTATIIAGEKIKSISVTNVNGILQFVPITIISDITSIIDLSNMSNGIYVVTIVTSENKVISTKLVKE